MGNLNEVATWPAGIPYFEADAILTGGPDCPDNIPIQALANRTVFLKKQIEDAVSGALAIEYANRLKTGRSIAMTGDGSWEVTFDGSGNVTAAMALANTGVLAGTYPVVTIDGKGRVTAARALQSADLPANAALAGAPTAPTAAPGTNDTQLANMAALQTAVQSAAAITSNAGGTADAITGSYTPAITTLTNGMPLLVRAASANTAATPTFTPNNGTIAAKPIVKGAGAALAAGDIAGAGHWLGLQYDQTLDKWVLLNPATGISSGSGKIIASLFTATRSVVAASGDTTVMTLNFTLTQATPVVVDWRAWFGGVTASQLFGNARVMLGAMQKSRSPRMHIGLSGAGYVYTDKFVGSTYLGVLAAGSYTVSVIWNNETAIAAVFNPGPTDSVNWSQADSEIIVRAAA